MKRFFSSSASCLALLAAGTCLSIPFEARAGSFTVTNGSTQTSQQTVSGNNTGQIDAGGTLNTSGTSILWNGAATAPDGVSIVNDGKIISGNRAIDTSGTISGPFTLTNNGSIQSTDDTVRVNNAFQNGNLHVVNAGSMISNTGQVLDLNSATAATATVTIENSGSMTATANDAIRFGAGTIKLTNSGTIQGQGANRALSFDTKGNVETLQSFTLVNQAGGKILGNNDAFKISAGTNKSSAVITIENSGLIDGGQGQAFDFADLTSPTNVITITNFASGVIQSATADAMRPGAGANVINYGLIQSTDLTSDGDGVDFQGAGGTVTNKAGGQILGAKHGITGDGSVNVNNEAGGLIVGRNGSGINIDSAAGTVTTVTNYGTIRGAVTGLRDDDGAADGVPDGDGDGIDVDGKIVLDNYGLIQGTGATGTKDGVLNTADGIAAGGGIIHNHAGGVIEAFDNYINDGVDNVGRGILIDDSAQGPAPFATTIINEGTIRSDGVTITLIGANADTIDNAGVIQSGNAKAVDMGGGDDLFIYRPGSQLAGYVTAGAGSDTFELRGSGSFDIGLLGDSAQYRDFESLLVDAGSSFTATGTSSFAGAVTVNGGLVLNGSLSSASASIGSGASLSGNASLGALTVGAGGSVSPGNSIGAINVAGTVTFDAGSTYVVQIDGDSSDQIVAGTSTINGGTVKLSALGPVTIGKVYTIVSASATTTPAGQFDTIDAPDFLFVDPTLGRDGASVTLEFTSNGTSIATLAKTGNQMAVADAIDAAGGGALYSAVAGATTGDEAAVTAGYDLLSGEAHASLGDTLFNQSILVADTLVGRLRQAAAGSSPVAAALAFSGPELAYGPASSTSSFPMSGLTGSSGPVYTAWGQAFGQWGASDGTSNAAKVDSSLGGILAGTDVTMGYATFGFAAGYASAHSDVDDRLSSADTSTILIAAYAGASFDNFRLSGGASHGWSDIDTSRTASMLGLTERPKASYDGSTTNLFVEAAYAAEAGGLAYEPFAQMAWSRVETDAFSETNAPNTGLSSSGLSMDVPYSTLGVRLAKSFAVGSGTLTPRATLAWRHAYGDVTPELALSFTGTGGSFSVDGAPIARDSFVLDAGIDFNVNRNLSLNIDYEGQLASGASTHSVRSGLTYRF